MRHYNNCTPQYRITHLSFIHLALISFYIMQYLAMIRTEQPQHWVFEESRDINEMMFRFKDKERPQSYAQTLANR